MKRQSTKRGFLLLEVMVSGVMAATVLGALMIAMGNMRQASVIGARDATAATLAQQRVEELNSFNFSYLDGLSGSPIVESIQLGGTYTRTTDISAKGGGGCQAFPAGGVYIDCHEIDVTVEYQSRSLIRALEVSLRIYDPNP